jgi:hypothetical protein
MATLEADNRLPVAVHCTLATRKLKISLKKKLTADEEYPYYFSRMATLPIYAIASAYQPGGENRITPKPQRLP